MVPSKETEESFREVEVGEIYPIQGSVDDIIYNLMDIKEPKYVIRMMATGGRFLADAACKEIVIIRKENGEDVVKNSNYKLPFDWNFLYSHAVEDHNNLRHSMLSIIGTWMNDWW